jgi:glycosyltransferase involved in cell wall biosynthesis
MLISIITVSYNSEVTIEDTITSVLNQTYQNIEYIIIDGKSTDGTVSIIKDYEIPLRKKGITYRWISEPDEGIYDAMNKGIKMAKGQIIGILNSDDWYEHDTVETIFSMCKDSAHQIYSGAMNRVDAKQKVYKTMFNKKITNVKNYMPINHPATFVSKPVYDKIGLFDTAYRLSADYDFIFRAFNEGISFKFTEKVLVNMRNTGATGQLNNIWRSAKEDYLIQKKNRVKHATFNYLKKCSVSILIVMRNCFLRPAVKVLKRTMYK